MRHLLIILILVYITRNSLASDQAKQTPLSIFYVREIRNILCKVTPSEMFASEFPLFPNSFPLNTPFHTAQFYVCGILMPVDRVEVQWIKLVGDAIPPLFL
jgi:hypothetical protein